MKGFKKTKLGWIPEGWKLRELKDFVTKSKAKISPLKMEFSLPCIEMEHIEKNTGFINGFVDSKSQKSTKNKFSTNQVLFGKLRPYLRKYWLASFDGVCSSEIWVLDSKTKYATNNFLFYFIQQYKFIQVANTTSGTKMPRADWAFLSSFPFLLPPLQEQKAIADCLGKWDAVIQLQQELIEQLEARKKWLMQVLLTGKKRLPGFEGEWKEYAYENLLKQVKRKVVWNDEDLYELISVRRRSGGLFFREALYGHQIKTKNLRTAKEGDFLISKMQIVHGASGLTTKEFDGMKISGSYLAIRAKDEKVLNIEFLDWVSRIPYFYHQCYVSSYGVHIEKMTFSYKLFLKESINLPSIQEQTAIVAVLNKADEELKLQRARLKELEEQKKGMMQQLLTGKKRLPIVGGD